MISAKILLLLLANYVLFFPRNNNISICHWCATSEKHLILTLERIALKSVKGCILTAIGKTGDWPLLQIQLILSLLVAVLKIRWTQYLHII